MDKLQGRNRKIITGCLILGNDKRWVEECILNHKKFFDKLIIFDGSIDGSIDIVRKYANKVIPQGDMEIDFSAFKNKCLEECDTEWAWFFHCAERLSLGEPDVIRAVLSITTANAYKLARVNEPNGADYPDYQTNIVRVGRGKYIRKLHEIYIPQTEQIFKEPVIRHLIRPKEELKLRDKRWMEIDPETQRRHLSRPEIKQRIKDEYGGNNGI